MPAFRSPLPWCSLALMTIASAVAAQDTDGDGLSDTLERQLATNPAFAEVLEVVAKGKTYDPTPQRPARYDITRVRFGNVAKGRWLWAIEFAEPYTFDNASAILYVDADNDPATGRGGLGCEVMYGHRAGRPWCVPYAADGSRGDESQQRLGLENGVLYICADIDLKQEGGRSKFRLWILSEQSEPHESRDSLRAVAVEGPGDSNRARMVTLADQTKDENFAVTQNMDLLWKIHTDQRNVILNSFKDCQAEGFVYYHSEYRWPAMRRIAHEATLTVRVPRAGRFHLGAIVYDYYGRECFEMEVDGKRVGRFIADADNRRHRLFFTPEPCQLKGGESIVLRAASDSGSCVVEDIVLLAEKPPVLAPRLEIRNLEVGYDRAAERMRATWLTTLPAKCTLHYDGGGLEEEEAVQNHRSYLPALEKGKTYSCSVDAGEAKSKPVQFIAGEPEAPRGTVARAQVKLSILVPVGKDGYGWPLTAGVPFPQGALGSTDNLRLLTPDGDEWAVQAKSLVHWPDGSVKVALLDTIGPQTHPMLLEYGRDVQARGPSGRNARPKKLSVRVRDDGQTVTMANVTMEVEFDRRASGVFTRIRHAAGRPYDFADGTTATRDDTPPRFVIVDDRGRAYDTLGPVDDMVVEEAGPLRAVVRLDGRHRNTDGAYFTYQVRATLYAFAPSIRLSYRWGNDVPDAEFAKFRSIRFELPLQDRDGARFLVGIENGDAPGGRLEQLHDNRYDIVTSGRKAVGKRAPGWAAASHPSCSVALMCRHFWQLYPKAISAGEGMLRLDLCPELGEKQYADCSDMDKLKLYYYLQDGRYKVRQGVAKTHEMVLLVGGKSINETESLTYLAGSLDEPPVLAAPPEWYAKSGVFGDFVPKTAQRTPVYDDACERAYHRYVSARDRGHMFGMLNFGDLFGERRVNWSNGEYDHHHTAAQMFVRAADARWRHLMEVMARHDIDVDLCHYHTNPRYRGASWVHAMGHTGGYFKKRYQGTWGIPGGGTTVSHTWTEGTCEHYLLTGDPSAIEAARSIADHYSGGYIDHYDFTNGRIPGWHLIHLMAVYRVTYDPYYLNAARIIVDRVLERRTPGSGWARQMVPGHCHCTPRCRGACSFMQGVLGIGLREYYKETQDERVPPAIVDSARYVIEQMWVPDRTAFRYTSCPESSITTSRTDTLAGLMLFAHELSGDPLFADVAVRGMNENLKHTPSVAHLRWMPYITYALDRLARSQLGLSGTTVRLKADGTERFDVRVFDRDGRGAPAGAAELIAPDNEKLVPDALGLIHVSPAVQGIYRLRLAPDSGHWLVHTDLQQMVVPVAKGLDLDVGQQMRRLFLNHSKPGGVEMGFQVRRGQLAARLLDPSGREVYSTETSSGDKLVLRKPANGLYELRLRGPAKIHLTATGVSSWATPAPWRHFEASAPSVTIKGDAMLLPGQGRTIRLRAEIDDPEGDLASIRWQLPNGKTAEGAELEYKAPEQDAFEIHVTATDRQGNVGRARVPVKLPPPELTDMRDVILVQAEAFTAQGKGEVAVHKRIGSMGRMITMWHANLGHWIEWCFEVAADGEYVILARYASDGEAPKRALTLDGKIPHSSYREIPFKPTGGYCTSGDNWAFKKLGHPVRLSTGQHRIRMTNLGDGLAMDYLAIARAKQ